MKTRVIFNRFIPFKGFVAMCFWPFIFVRKEAMRRYGVYTDNHESIHAEQQKEMLAVGVSLAVIGFLIGFGLWSLLFFPLFFWWYGIEWLFRVFQYRNGHVAYKNISFEREAYGMEYSLGYLSERRHFAWLSYLRMGRHNVPA